MHIKRHIKNSKRILFCVMLFVMLIGSVSCGAKEIEKENDEIDFEKYFAQYDDKSGADGLLKSCTSYDVREMELQIDGFWDYYERYEKAQQDLDQVIKEWETDFIGEGTYIIGRDIPAGRYVFCNPDGDNNDDGNAISTRNRINTSYADIFKSPHFSVVTLQNDDVLKVKGSPKFAPIDQFPEFSVSDDGNYYGKYYIVGKNIPEGTYLVLSMDIKDGEITLGGNAQPLGGFPLRAPCTRFKYVILVDNGKDDEGNYLELYNSCMLIPIENKPSINPILHEDITYKNKAAATADVLRILLRKETEIERNNYSDPIYAQGGYIIGDDLPLGTYQIQCEVAWNIRDRDSKEYQSDHISIGSGNCDYSWSGINIYYQDMAEQCGWKNIRLGMWEGGRQRVGIEDPGGNMSGYTVYEGELPSVTFTEKDKGVIISIIRAILIPE